MSCLHAVKEIMYSCPMQLYLAGGIILRTGVFRIYETGVFRIYQTVIYKFHTTLYIVWSGICKRQFDL